MKRRAALLAGLFLSAPALATPAAFAEANNYWPAGLLPNLSLGTLLHVDRVNIAPSRTEVVCTAAQMGVVAQSVSRALFSSQFHAGAGETSMDELGQFLDAVNMIHQDEVLVSLALEIENVETFSLPGNDMPDGLGGLAQPCLLRIAQLLENRPATRSNLVVLNSELMADIDVTAIWARARPSLAARVLILSHLGDVLDLNGGQVGPTFIHAPFQRIGWRHDEGAWLQAAVLR